MPYVPPTPPNVNFNFSTAGYTPPTSTNNNPNFGVTGVTTGRRRQITGAS